MAHVLTDGTTSLGYILLIIVYVLLILACGYATLLYRQAFVKMKRTRMIQSVMILMVGLMMDATYWTIVTIAHAFNPPLAHVMLTTYFAVIPKFILLCAIVYFLYATLTPTQYVDTVDQAKNVAQKTMEEDKKWHRNKK